jgi:predicted N-acetyltransferase YhbS
MTSLPLTIGLESPDLAAAIDRLHERAFGPGRFARSAFRLREGADPLPEMCFVARVATLLVGSVRISPIRIGGVPAVLLGPLTVEPAFMGQGIGSTLMQAALDAAREHGHRLVMLVGDEPYYGRFGFRRVPEGRVVLPGPVDPRRVLVCELVAGAFDGVEGAAEAARS